MNSAAWFLTPLLGVLVALYFWEQQRRRIDVPSLLLWEVVPEAVIRTSRFRPDLLFLLQLLLLSFLLIGFARPYLSAGKGADDGQRYIFVLDNSASMQTVEEGGTRFDEAREQLLRRISALSADDEAMLISAASYPRVLMPFSRNHAALSKRVNSLRPVDTGTQLEPALALARRAAMRDDRPTRIALFTDLAPSLLGEEWRSDVDTFQVGKTDDNLAIEGLEIFQGRFQDPVEASARVTIRNFSGRDKHGFLSVRLDGEIVSRRGFSLGAGEVQNFPLQEFPHSGVLHATLEVDDALDVDNHAYGWIRPRKPIELLVVSDTPSLRGDLERIAQSVNSLDFHFLSPAEYEDHPDLPVDVLLFEGYVPDGFPPRPSLYVYPSRSSPWFSVTGDEHRLHVSNWDETHPAIGNLRPQLVFPLSDVRILQLPDWLDVLLSSNHHGQEIPLAFAGEHNGRRLAGISFNLAAEHLLSADSVNLLLLFVNLLDWLLPADSDVLIQRSGEIYSVPSPPHPVQRVVDPVGQITLTEPGESLRVELAYAGEYRIGTAPGSRSLYANFVDPVESDIGRNPSEVPVAHQTYTDQSPRSSGKAPFDAWLYTLAAAFFLVEWVVAMRT